MRHELITYYRPSAYHIRLGRDADDSTPSIPPDPTLASQSC